MWANRRSIFQGAKVCIKIELFKKKGFGGGGKFNKIFAFFVKMRDVSIKKKRTNRSMLVSFCSCLSSL